MEGNLKKNMCVCVCMYTHIQTDIYAAESLCCLPETDITLWVNYISILKNGLKI